jgi:uncharacterized protein (TIGR02391 family)
MVRRREVPQELVEREFRSVEEIDEAIRKLERRIQELQRLDVQRAFLTHDGTDDVAESNVRATIREVFGPGSPEFKEHEYLNIWAGPMFMDMADGAIIEGKKHGVVQTIGILNGLIGRIREKREDLTRGVAPAISDFGHLNLHPRILEASQDLFVDGHPWEAVFAAAKTLVNYVKDRSGRHELDGAPLMRTVFSANNPILAFNDLRDQTDRDEQEGMMHLFEGAVQAIRNPGGHSFPEGSQQRAVEYISFLSLLAYRIQEARVRRTP